MASGARIFMYSTYFPPEFSGAAKQAISLAKALRSRGVDVAFLTVRFPGTSRYEEREGFPVFRFRLFRRLPLGEFLFWGRIFLFLLRKRRSFEWIHSHGAYYTNAALAWMARRLGKKSILKVSLAGNDLAGVDSGRRGRLHRLFLESADVIAAISTEIESELERKGISSEAVFRCPNGVDVERFTPADSRERAALRRRFSLPEDDILFLYAGVVDERKNVAWLVEQWIKYCKGGGRGHLLVVGPVSREDPGGVFFGRLARRPSDNGLGSRMTMSEYVERIEDYYRACDVFILPSLGEGMPNAVLEAMACGLPVIATRTSGTTDLIAEGEDGYLFNPGDGEGLLGRLSDLAGDSSRRSRMAARSRLTAKERFSMETIAGRYAELYWSERNPGMSKSVSSSAGEGSGLVEAHRA